MTMTVMSRQMTFCLRQGRRQCIQNRPSLVNASSSSSPDIKSLDELRDLLNQTVDESEKKRVLEVESEYRRYMGESMPSEVTDVMWNKLAKAQSERSVSLFYFVFGFAVWVQIMDYRWLNL